MGLRVPLCAGTREGGVPPYRCAPRWGGLGGSPALSLLAPLPQQWCCFPRPPPSTKRGLLLLQVPPPPPTPWTRGGRGALCLSPYPPHPPGAPYPRGARGHGGARGVNKTGTLRARRSRVCEGLRGGGGGHPAPSVGRRGARGRKGGGVWAEWEGPGGGVRVPGAGGGSGPHQAPPRRPPRHQVGPPLRPGRC